jgi:hypothetical protein
MEPRRQFRSTKPNLCMNPGLWIRKPLAHREVIRAKALLMASDGMANTAIAQSLSVAPASVANWRARFAEDGVSAGRWTATAESILAKVARGRIALEKVS